MWNIVLLNYVLIKIVIFECNKDKIVRDVTCSSTWLLFAWLQTWVAWYGIKLLILFFPSFSFRKPSKQFSQYFWEKLLIILKTMIPQMR